MKPYPHHYQVKAHAGSTGTVDLRAENLPPLTSAPPIEFDGPGDQWSPESLLVAAVVDCFVLTFRALARAADLEWTTIHCRADGTLDRVERVTRFVGIRIVAELALPRGGTVEPARQLLEKAERNCLVTNSLNFRVELDATATVAG